MIPKKVHFKRSDVFDDARVMLAKAMLPPLGGGNLRIRHDEASSGHA